MDRLTDAAQLEGWVPVRLYWREAKPTVDWCYLGAQRFEAAFFEQTIGKCMARPFNLLFRHQTPVEVLEQWQQTRPGIDPTGFIFHMSRCGSTLVSQMLKAIPTNVVVSEARPIDATLRSQFTAAGTSDEQRIKWLRWMLSAMGQRRLGGEQHFFVKFDAWNTLDLPLIRRAFPDVPWIFLYRDPVEVLVSHFSNRGAHMIPGVLTPSLFGMDVQTAFTLSPEDYCAKVLASICAAALQHYRDGGRLVSYPELPEVVPESLLKFFKLRCSAEEIDGVRGAAKRDAKNSSASFQSDSQKKRDRASDAIRDAAQKWLDPIYENLEAARHQQP
ncbi:MAG TPA: sulfotransferase, partial [Pyrinomonadaceae bacterium]